MSNYMIGPGGELRHAAPNRGWEKDDHKYVKREWKNGKWVYTYPSDAKKQQSSQITTSKNNTPNAIKAHAELKKKRQDVDKTLTPKIAANKLKDIGKAALGVAKKTASELPKTSKAAAQNKTSANPKTKSDDKTSVKKETDWFATAKKWVGDKIDDAGKWIDDKIDDAADWVDDKVDSAGKWVKDEVNSRMKKLDDYVATAGTFVEKLLYDDPNNPLTVSRYNYNEKVAAIMETDEWKDIVARQDSEYVVRRDDGTVEYKIDDYIVDKKHPVLDAIGDIAAGRPITTHEITMDSTVAGLKDYGQAALEIGMLGVGFTARGLENKFKFSMGSYDDDINRMVDTVNAGYNYVTSTATEAERLINDINPSDVEKLVTAMRNTSTDRVNSTVNSTASIMDRVNSGDVVTAITMLLETDAVKNKLGTNEYYQAAESVLTNLSDEEIELLNLAIRELTK